MSGFKSWLRAAAAAGMVAVTAGAAHSAEPLSWSFSSTGVGYCNSATFACQTGPGGSLTFVSQGLQYDLGINASSSASDPTYGLAHSSAAPGDGLIALPELHADVTGGHGAGDYSWNYAQAQGVQGFTWTGDATDLNVSAFQATLEFTIGGAQGYGEAGAAFAILSSAVEDRAVGDLWYPADGNAYGFLAGCGTAGAIAVGETGAITGLGAHSVTVMPTCGQSTFHVETGDNFYLWARLSTFHLNDGFTDASNTFSVNLSPDLSPETVQFLAANLVPTGPLDLGTSVPEPNAWALMVLGFGGLGAALRRRRSRLRPVRASPWGRNWLTAEL